MLLTTCIQKLMNHESLDRDTCEAVLAELLIPETNPLQIAAFLVLLRAKPETAEELVGLAKGLQQVMITVPMKHRVLDIVGTGADNTHTVNISTGSALLAASCGVKVAKHGNRAVSSQAGSADVLEALGVNIQLSPHQVAACVETVGFGFCFAPLFHPALLALRQLRKALGVPTSLHLLGPLLNPTKPSHLLLGVFSADQLDLVAKALQQLGTERSMIVHGQGLDELSCIGPAEVRVVTPHTRETFHLNPTQFGLIPCQPDDLRGSNANENAALLQDTFSGVHTQKHQAIADTLIFNAAVALYLYGLHDTISDAVQAARESLQTGKAMQLLRHLIEFSHA